MKVRRSSICGIYALVNKSDRKIYVGSSNGVRGRIHTHAKQLKKGVHANRHLQAAYNRGDRFKSLLLEKCPEESLIRREQHYMDLHKTQDAKVRKPIPNCLFCGKPTPNHHRKYCDEPACVKAAKGSHVFGNQNGKPLKGHKKSAEVRENMRQGALARYQRERGELIQQETP
jgi:group I intron endonuclease